MTAWGVLWRDRGCPRCDHIHTAGDHLIWDTSDDYRLFRTRREARAYIEKAYGYIRERSDLRGCPHHWRLPVAGRVTVEPARRAA